MRPQRAVGRECRASPMAATDQEATAQAGEELPETIGEALTALGRSPWRWLVRNWNWKNALLSTLARSSIFFGVNLTASWNSALDAALTELLYRAPMVGILASLSQTFRGVQPAWKATLAIMFGLPALAHAAEFTIHSLRGTDKLYESVAASIGFSMVTAVVSYFLHRRGVLIVGHGARPFVRDVIELPIELLDLVGKPLRAACRRSWRGPSLSDRS